MLELVLDEDCLWVAAGSREPGATEWSIERSDPKMFRFNDGAAAAKADYDKRVAKLPKSAKLVGEATPVITPQREESLAQREALMSNLREWDAEHGLGTKLETDGVARIVGKKDANRDEYIEVAVEGTTVVMRHGKLTGGKPRLEKEQEPNRERAISTAKISSGRAWRSAPSVPSHTRSGSSRSPSSSPA